MRQDLEADTSISEYYIASKSLKKPTRLCAIKNVLTKLSKYSKLYSVVTINVCIIKYPYLFIYVPLTSLYKCK